MNGPSRYDSETGYRPGCGVAEQDFVQHGVWNFLVSNRYLHPGKFNG